ncbi:MAG: amidase family protein [Deltaproteobacteria bacterium]|nr:amidase family protein [Deltaproteobacteria bacterium]
MTDSRPLYTLSATEALAGFADQSLTSEALVQAMIDRADRFEPMVASLTERFIEGSLERAREADQARARGESWGPLHGLPITIKESIEIAGSACTLGLPSRVNTFATRDAAIVQALREAGAIVIARTNVSQLMLSFECRNPVFGQCQNPRKLTHAPGGSSGGEAAAIAYGASMLGVGTDIGGSIRLPAHFSGVAGFKPTQDRWPNLGLATSLPGQEGIRSQCGPLARTVADLTLAFRALDPMRLNALDSRVGPLPWRDPAEISLDKMRIGVIHTDGIIDPSPALSRALHRAGEALVASGCELVDFAIPEPRETLREYFATLSADGAETARRALGDAPIDVTLKGLLFASKIPAHLRKTLVRAAKMAGQDLTALVLDGLGERSVHDLWKLVAKLRKRRAVIEDMMQTQRISALIMPPFATPAVPHTFGAQFAQAASYTMFWNLTHFPAGVLPVTTVVESDLTRPPSRDVVVRRAIAVDQASVGLPVGVQVIAPAWHDERVLALMSAIENYTRNDPGRPSPVVDPA